VSSRVPGDQWPSTTLSGKPFDDRCQCLFASVTALVPSAGRKYILIPATRLELNNRAFSVSDPTAFDDLLTELERAPIQLFLNANLKHFYSAKPMMLQSHNQYLEFPTYFILF
jgi:hypothetical protein